MTSWVRIYIKDQILLVIIYILIFLDEIFNRKLIDSFFVNKDFKYETLPVLRFLMSKNGATIERKSKNWISENPDLYFLFFIKK